MTTIFFIILFCLTLCFSVFLLYCFFGWIKLESASAKKSNSSEKVSVIIAARNEEKSIRYCLDSLSKQDFPSEQMDIIVVDDHSTDRTVNEVQEFTLAHPKMNIFLLQLDGEEGSSKKAAITFAVSRAKTEGLLITDADCLLPTSWVRSMHNCFYSKDVKFLAGPVDIESGTSLFSKLQNLEFIGLVGIAAAGISQKQPILCNGANIMFSKKVFNEVGGFESERELASGDDTQLLLKVFNKYPEEVYFLKDESAIVITQSVSLWSEFVEQRKRWAGKIPFALTPFTIFIAVLAWFTHALMLTAACLLLIKGDLNYWFVSSLFILCFTEVLLLNSMASFFKKRSLLWLFLPAQFVYWIYIVVIGAIAPLSKFQWKGRVAK